MDASGIDCNAIAKKWLNQLEASIATTRTKDIEALFLEESFWRDTLALTWDIQTIFSQDEISKALSWFLKKTGAQHFRLDLSNNPPVLINRIGTDTIEAFFKFETTVGRSRGIIRLCSDASDGGTYKAWTILTALEELKGFEEKK